MCILTTKLANGQLTWLCVQYQLVGEQASYGCRDPCAILECFEHLLFSRGTYNKCGLRPNVGSRSRMLIGVHVHPEANSNHFCAMDSAIDPSKPESRLSVRSREAQCAFGRMNNLVYYNFTILKTFQVLLYIYRRNPRTCTGRCYQ